MHTPSLVWFRLDLRLQDNPALAAAIERNEPIIPIFIESSEEESPWAAGGASRVWLHAALEDLQGQLAQLGSQLIIRRGPSQAVLESLIQETGAGAIFWNRRYEPAAIDRDSHLKKHFEGRQLHVQSFNSALLHEPHTVLNKAGKPFQVFTPYWRHCLTLPKTPPVSVDLRHLKIYEPHLESLQLQDLGLLPNSPWDAGIRKAWKPTRAQALKNLKRFETTALNNYPQQRDFPNEVATSRMSPYLHFGQLGVRELWAELKSNDLDQTPAGSKFLSEIGWREFAYHLLYHFPETPDKPLRPEFEGFPWEENTHWVKAWQQGQTGYPLIDAGMRELWQTGWMHNRVRMVVASFLVKQLLQPWVEGARWFWDTLVDADLASNTLGWQWSAGCGADAAPYFRVFNPVLQSKKFDAEAQYIRQYVPELKNLPNTYIHTPWEAPAAHLKAAGVILATTYPKPIIPHELGRARALNAYEKWRALR
ncbi:MAG: deoxyribodipyrimidine photolyase [Verrucomicrobia bacterium 21-51-4]|nr:MAG: deoxyribodipyrimidine photolyase [Verrucomicrobia bacterium 21-51-4]HQU09082.1 deoxyribodipyrimidine photo-lyase [Opitutales bacterium]